MRIVFVEWNDKITANWVSDKVEVGMANMVWHADGRQGEVIAEVSVRTYDGPLTDERAKFYEEIFELGRLYGRNLEQRSFNETHDSIDD